MNSTYTATTSWFQTLHDLAKSGELEQALISVFGQPAMTDNLRTLVKELARGNSSFLPQIVSMDPEVLQGHPGAYDALTNTIYVDARVLEIPSLALEVLTHEWAHALANSHVAGHENPSDAYALTKELLGRDHALLMSSHETHAQTDAGFGSGQLTLPGSKNGVAVRWFDTALHIDWARAQLPMLNAKAFDLFKLGQNDSDAFAVQPANFRVGITSPYGLQTSSATHFDNNNVRGSIETMRKRWSDGLENFEANKTYAKVFTIFLDSSLVGPSFKGTNAGLENLIYRFGQIEHAFQDFYSHSNWVEMVNAGWIKSGTLLDEGLDLPKQLNPGDYLGSTSAVMVAMGGPDYDHSLVRAGIGAYAGGPKVVHWWVQDRQTNWGEVFALPKSGTTAPADRVGGLMTGAVNGAIYYDTDFSLPLRAVNRTGFFEAEYFRGFSHGGLAGTVAGQWIEPLSKDKPDNSRFSDKNANRVLFEQAQDYAAQQVRHDFDRMGNLIFKQYGEAGLRAFAEFALTEFDRDTYVSTYSSPGGRWDWDNALQTPQLAKMFAVTASEEAPSSDDFHFDESNMRFIEVYYAEGHENFSDNAHPAYLTQVFVDGRWQDAAAGLINTHHGELEEYGPEAFVPAPVQHTQMGGRAVWSSPYVQEGHYLGTVYFVSNENSDALVKIPNFDVGRDLLQLVDAQGQLIHSFDLDHADYPVQRQRLLEQHNIDINARPETEGLTMTRVIGPGMTQGSMLLSASDFFADMDAFESKDPKSKALGQDTLIFAGHDETRPWLDLRADGQLEILDIAQVPRGLHEIYVSVTDGEGLLENALIVLAVDPQIRIGDRTYDPSSAITISLRSKTEAATGLWGQVVDDAGRPEGLPEQWGTSLGLASGLPTGVHAGIVKSSLASEVDHGTMHFFADLYDRKETVPLEVRANGEGRFELWLDGQVFADLDLQSPDPEAFVDTIYVPGQGDVFIGVPLPASLDTVTFDAPGLAHQVRLQMRVVQDSPRAGQFGFILMDLQSGDVIDPRSGVHLENLRLDSDNILDYAVYKAQTSPDKVVESSNHFLIDTDLLLNNLALQPFFIFETQLGKQLLLSGVGGTVDGISPIVRVDQNSFGVEDLVDGDYDFDDVVVTITGLNVAAFDTDRVAVWDVL
ncbi:hypothetical protein [Limnohabitans sp.]|uniref:hypothetical protein n=1 Tax=Limnohabitans sp. TaxID=1907725 RepID=UPI002AFE1174|nr:hypothetical protein [Limnohabitans sp.]